MKQIACIAVSPGAALQHGCNQAMSTTYTRRSLAMCMGSMALGCEARCRNASTDAARVIARVTYN